MAFSRVFFVMPPPSQDRWSQGERGEGGGGRGGGGEGRGGGRGGEGGGEGRRGGERERVSSLKTI